jgi:hypothetical protein
MSPDVGSETWIHRRFPTAPHSFPQDLYNVEYLRYHPFFIGLITLSVIPAYSFLFPFN